jgi:hypothetical protein
MLASTQSSSRCAHRFGSDLCICHAMANLHLSCSNCTEAFRLPIETDKLPYTLFTFSCFEREQRSNSFPFLHLSLSDYCQNINGMGRIIGRSAIIEEFFNALALSDWLAKPFAFLNPSGYMMCNYLYLNSIIRGRSLYECFPVRPRFADRHCAAGGRERHVVLSRYVLLLIAPVLTP